jgi:microtubule-associated protein tau
VSASPKVGSLQNASHVPAGGNVKIENRKLNFREAAKPRVEAKSEVEIPKSDVKASFKRNMETTMAFVLCQISTKKLVWNAESKVGSLEKATHKPGGGNVQVNRGQPASH